MAKTIVDDGFAPYLVNDAEFDGKWEIPIIKNDFIEIHNDIVPLDKIKKISKVDRKKYLCIFICMMYPFERFSDFGGIISPDFSLYIDMPLCLQMANVYLNRAVGYYFQSKGVKVIPNVR